MARQPNATQTGKAAVIVRLYLDEDATRPGLLQGLQARYIDAVTVYQAGRGGLSDEEQLLYATEQGRAIFTFNQGDFVELHTRFLESGISHAGIIIAAQGRYGIGEQIRRLAAIVRYLSAEDLKDQLIFLSAWGQANYQGEKRWQQQPSPLILAN